jgi:transcription-repair coupling factor (superfamily II helicase)
MEIFDVLQKLKEIQEAPATPVNSVVKNEDPIEETMSRQHFQYVADTLKNIEDTTKRAEYAKHHSAIFQHFNPRFDHAKFMAAAGVNEVEEGRVKDWLMDLESDAVDMTREEFIKKHGQSQAHVWDRVQKQEKENESVQQEPAAEESVQEAKPDFLDMDKDGNTKEPMKKAIKDKEEKMKESVVITTDNPEEASMMMRLLQMAGVKPLDQDMINQPENTPHVEPGNTCDSAEETYANEPDTKMQNTDTLVNFHSGGLNRQKGTFPKVAGGDNPMQKTEDFSDSLRKQYAEFKANYQAAVNEAKKAKSPYAVGMAQAMKTTGDKPPLKKTTIKKAHDIAKAVKKGK